MSIKGVKGFAPGELVRRTDTKALYQIVDTPVAGLRQAVGTGSVRDLKPAYSMVDFTGPAFDDDDQRKLIYVWDAEEVEGGLFESVSHQQLEVMLSTLPD